MKRSLQEGSYNFEMFVNFDIGKPTSASKGSCIASTNIHSTFYSRARMGIATRGSALHRVIPKFSAMDESA